MDIPSWADEELSKDLPVLRARGEGQNLEYKKEFPENTSDLAKKIAAFATSNQGTILIGVSDPGDLVGIKNGHDKKVRDNLLQRLEGICRGTVKPAITPVAKFAVENEQVVLVINVPHGTQPIYYSNDIPYVRHLTEVRPAEPHEVIELVADFLATQNFRENEDLADEHSVFYSDLARVIGKALIYAEQASDRQVNPWFDQWRSEFSYAAQELRELSVQDIAIEDHLSNELNALASSLDEVVSFRPALGCGEELSEFTAVPRKSCLSIITH